MERSVPLSIERFPKSELLFNGNGLSWPGFRLLAFVNSLVFVNKRPVTTSQRSPAELVLDLQLFCYFERIINFYA